MTARAWQERTPPRRILAIRLQATGDVVITLPYLRALQQTLPNAEIDFVTRRSDRELPQAIRLFRHVFHVAGGWSERRQLLLVPFLIPRLLARRYDAVLDLQNNRVSSTIRRAVAPRAWTTFDRYGPKSAGERTRLAIEAAGFPLPRVEAALPLEDPGLGMDVLHAAGWDRSRELVILSPAGAFASRNWPLDNYVRFAELWRRERRAQFAILGLPALAKRADVLDRNVPDMLNLVGRTTTRQALAIVQRAALVLTEDCGLMHMAWVSGVPTLALFGSSRHDWSTPLGAHSVCLHSGDLDCGACMEPTCRYGDVHCLTRYQPEDVVAQAVDLLSRTALLPARMV